MKHIERSILLKRELDQLRPLSKEDEARIMQKFRLDWNYHSNNLEGNTLTYGETKALILHGITAQGKPLKDHFEITGHNEAILWILDIVKEKRPLTENFIRELHKLILKESYEVDAITPDGLPTKKKVHVGIYKTSPNHVKTKTGELFRFATPEETPALMHDLVRWYRSRVEDPEINAILLAAQFHYRYIRIHPFDDGNGRTARILMNFILMKFGYPPVIIKTEDKQNYFTALRQADAGIIEPFIEYIAENLNRSLELMIQGAKGESIEEADDVDKEIALLEQRLNGIGKTIEITKNRDVLLDVYDHSLVDLIKVFKVKGEVFEKFYKRVSLVLRIDGRHPISIDNEVSIQQAKPSFKDDTLSLVIEFFYGTFNRAGFDEFNYTAQISIRFYETFYFIQNSKGEKWRQLYDQPLKNDEITFIVNSEIRRHTQFIEDKINEIENDGAF